jgi:hypothetical protein
MGRKALVNHGRGLMDVRMGPHARQAYKKWYNPQDLGSAA